MVVVPSGYMSAHDVEPTATIGTVQCNLVERTPDVDNQSPYLAVLHEGIDSDHG